MIDRKKVMLATLAKLIKAAKRGHMRAVQTKDGRRVLVLLALDLKEAQ